MKAALRAGIAIYNDGEYHAAHDAWEDRWLSLEKGTDDELLLHGLIQFTAAVYHARRRNWSGAVGLAESACEYLAPLPPEFRGVNVDEVRACLDSLERDPEVVERRRPLTLTFERRPLGFADLDVDAACVAAVVLAEEYPEYDETVLERAVEVARDELADGTRSRFVALVMDFVTEESRRGVVYQRLDQHLDRREQRTRDVDGLFE
ncbi:MAG: DUF309 domain-containing protein [Halobacteriota archaeon]